MIDRWTGNYWLPAKDGEPDAARMYARHYSSTPYADGRRSNLLNRNRHLFVGPGEKMVLMNIDRTALFVWRKFIDMSGQIGINCAIFRNESNILSSKLIFDAEICAWNRWPGERLYTYVNPRKVASPNPGYCFKIAGWQLCGVTKTRGLLILEKYPEAQS